MTDHLFIEINHTRFFFKDGETILEIAHRNYIDIPTLCHLKGTTPNGECRICVVEVNKEFTKWSVISSKQVWDMVWNNVLILLVF